MSKKEFIDAKEKALKALDKAESEHRVDTGITSLLHLINQQDDCYTTSSCAGRIVVLQLPEIGDKQLAQFLGIWHRTVKPDEILSATNHATKGLIWLLAQAPILHMGTNTLEQANHLVKIAISSGFKNSAIKSTAKKFIIEISSTERLDALIGNNGKICCESEYLLLLVDISNQVIDRSQKKLLQFEKNLQNEFKKTASKTL